MKLMLAALGVSLLVAGCAAGPTSTAATATPAAPASAQMDMHMKAMQDMRAKMMAAKTPEERATLMKDHMKTMQDGMDMMGRMRGGQGGMGGGMAMSPEMMGKRMDMMEMMMQMMMDREAMKPAGSK